MSTAPPPAVPAPTVSVLMPTHRGEHLVGETIASVLAQDFADFEIVVVDDCSPDGTAAAVRAIPDPRIRLIVAPVNGGPVAARNLGFAAVRGRYVAGLDHDDLCLPGRLAAQVAWLDAHPEAALVGTDAELLTDGRVSPDATRPRATSPDLLDWLLLVTNPLVWSSVMFRAGAGRALAPFERQAFVYAEDFDFYHRIRRHGRVARIDAPLLRYRVHPAGLSKTHAERMIASASAVLAGAYRELLGETDLTEEEIGEGARLVGAHIAGARPVTSADTLARLAATLDRLHEAFSRRPLAEQERARIAAETSRLWWRIVRQCVRSGTLPFGAAMAARPRVVTAAPRVTADLLASGAIGAARRLRG